MEPLIFNHEITKIKSDELVNSDLIEYTSYAFLISGGIYYINYSGQRYSTSCKYFNNTISYISGISLIINSCIIIKIKN